MKTKVEQLENEEVKVTTEKNTEPLEETKKISQKQLRSTKAANPANKTSGICVYIGPSIAGVIQSGCIYKGTKEQIIELEGPKGAINKYPRIAQLIVPVEVLTESRIKTKTPGNVLYVNYQKLLTGK